MKETGKKIVSLLVMAVMVIAMMVPSYASASTQAGLKEGGTAPETDNNGVYLLEDADDLTWFATAVNGGETGMKAKLTKNIDLTGVEWTPIKEFTGDFDGQNHSISNFTYTQTAKGEGLFGTNKGTIENISNITGQLTAAYSAFGSVAGINQGTITNCHSSVDINIITTAGSANNGGIAGENSASGSIRKCSFDGSVKIGEAATTASARMGGIVGYMNNGSPSVIGCINRGTIQTNNQQSEYIGGIVGWSTAGNIIACYNSGMIGAPTGTTKANVCHITYSTTGTNITNCYSSGTISGGTDYGVSKKGNVNSYFLSDKSDDTTGAATQAELKSVNMVSRLNAATTATASSIDADCKFQKTDSYPSLAWEKKGVTVSEVAVTSVSITGTFVTGNTLKAQVQGVGGQEPTNISYQWQMSNDNGYEDITDAVYATFSMSDTAVYAGKKIRIVVSGDKGSKVTSEATTAIEKSDTLKVTEDKAALPVIASPVVTAQKLELPSTGANGCSITWESNHTDVISAQGDVVLPESGYKSVTLKATVKSNDVSQTKSYSLSVQSVDYQNVTLDKNELAFSISNIYEAQTLTLPSTGEHGSAITWTSNNTSYITNDGVVTLPESGSQYVSLTATFTINDTSITKSCGITVYSESKGSVMQDKDSLTMPEKVEEAQTLTLVTEGAKGSTISWKSNNTDVISDEGVVTLPETGFVNVSLTATIEKGTDKVTKSFSIRVCSPSSLANVLHVKFNLIGDDVHGSSPHKNFYKWIWEEPMEYKEADAKTVSDLIDDVFAKTGFIRLGQPNYISGITTPDGIELSQMMNGSMSGWMYQVNGVSPNYGVTGYTLKEGDVVTLYYVHTYGETAEEPVDTPVKELSLTENKKTVKEGNSFELKADIAPSYATDQTVTWSSADQAIATVDKNGKVTAVKAGKTTITAMANADNEIKSSCEVTVTAADQGKNPAGGSTEAPKAGRVTLNYQSLDVQKGTKVSVIKIASSTLENDVIVSAKSSKTAVAAVSVKEGTVVIRAHKTGQTVITVTTKGGATAKVKVAVKKKVSVKKLSFNMTKAALAKGKKLKLQVTKIPVTGTEKITWKTSNKTIATVNGKGVVKAKKKGTVKITAVSSNGKKVTCKVKVTAK